MLFEYFVPEIVRITAAGPENNIACA